MKCQSLIFVFLAANALGQNFQVPSNLDFGTVNTGTKASSGLATPDFYQVLTVKNVSSTNLPLLGIAIINSSGPNFFFTPGTQCPQYPTSSYQPPIILAIGQAFYAQIDLQVFGAGITTAIARVYCQRDDGTIDSLDVQLKSAARDTSEIFVTGPSGGSVVFCACNPDQSQNYYGGGVEIFNKSSNKFEIDSAQVEGDTSEFSTDVATNQVINLNDSLKHFPVTIAAGGAAANIDLGFQPHSSGLKTIQMTLFCEQSSGEHFRLVFEAIERAMYIVTPEWVSYPSVVLNSIDVGSCVESDPGSLTIFYCGDSLHCLDTAAVSLEFVGARSSYFSLVPTDSLLSMAPGSQMDVNLKYCPLTPQRDPRDSVYPFGSVFDSLLITFVSTSLSPLNIFELLDTRTTPWSPVAEQQAPTSFEVSTYPNPIRTQLIFNVEGVPSPLHIVVCDVLGRVVDDMVNSSASNFSWKPADQLPNGTYFITILSTNGSRSSLIHFERAVMLQRN